MFNLLDTLDLQKNFPVHYLSGSFYLYTTLSFLFLSILPALVTFVSGEKVNPFYTQRKVSYYFTCYVLLLGIFLFINTLYWDGDFNVVVEDPMLLIDYKSNLELVSSTSNMFKNSMLISYSRIGLLVFTLVSVILSYEYLNSVRYNHFEFYMYVLLSTFAMIVLVSSNHALLTYLAIELQSLSLYLMASSYRKSIHSIEAGLKYVFIGSLASGGLLIGFAMLYLATGTLDFSQASNVVQHLTLQSIDNNNAYYALKNYYKDLECITPIPVSTDPSLISKFNWVSVSQFFMPMFELVYSTSFYLYVSAGLIIFALLLKMASAPFHTWLPDVYDGAPTSATSYFLLVPKIAIVVILYRFTHELFFWDELSYTVSNLKSSIDPSFYSLHESRYTSSYLYKNKLAIKSSLIEPDKGAYQFEKYSNRIKAYLDNHVLSLFKADQTLDLEEKIVLVEKIDPFEDNDEANYYGEKICVSIKNSDISDNFINFYIDSQNKTVINNGQPTVFTSSYDLPPVMPQRFQHVFAPAIIMSVLYSFVIGYSGLLKRGINLKRFFAFSSIGHLGFILLPFTLNPDYISSATLSSVVVYMFIYILATIPSIKVIMLFTSSKALSSVGRRVHYSIDRLPALFHIISPANALFVFVLFITFVGIPPTAGFFMKLYPLLGLVSSPNPIIFFIWPIIVFSSYVYVRVLVSLFFGNFNEADPRAWVNISTSEGYLSTWLSSFSMLFLATYAFQIDIIEVIAMDMIL